MDHDQNKAQIAQFSVKDAEKFGEYEAMLNGIVAAVDPLLDHAPPNLYGNLTDKIKTGWPLAKAGLKLGNDANLFYEMMTAPTTKILNKWFESEPLKATLATDACIGAMISPGMLFFVLPVLPYWEYVYTTNYATLCLFGISFGYIKLKWPFKFAIFSIFDGKCLVDWYDVMLPNN